MLDTVKNTVFLSISLNFLNYFIGLFQTETIMTSSFDEGNGTDEACSPTASSGTTSCGYSDNDSLLPSHSQSSFSVKNCRLA